MTRPYPPGRLGSRSSPTGSTPKATTPKAGTADQPEDDSIADTNEPTPPFYTSPPRVPPVNRMRNGPPPLDSAHLQHGLPPLDHNRVVEAILGGNPPFSDTFFGEPMNQFKPLRPAPGEAPDNMNMDNNHGGSVAPYNARMPIRPPNMSMDELILAQLEEDLGAYRADLDFARVQLHPFNAMDQTPAETRTFQLRVLDLGHQMRSINHRKEIMLKTMSRGPVPNGYAAATANGHMGAYPPGTNITPDMRSGPVAYNQQAAYGGQQPPNAYMQYSHNDQERRRPGRPLGARNRLDAPQASGPQAVSGPATVKNGPSAIGSAAALAIAGAKRGGKRGANSEIHVATSSGGPSSAVPSSPDAKRIRLDEDGTVNSDETTENEITAIGKYGHPTIEVNDSEDESFDHNNSSMMSDPGASHYTAGHNPYAAGMAVTASGKIRGPLTDGPAGDTYQRLGYWRCRLCTSQKYLNAPPPKQPSEAGTWPLRDVSKIITHFTRMHGEHNTIERCMELGAALAQNRGPFRYWLTVTKKEKGWTAEGVAATVQELEDGQMPDMLRKMSKSAALFPEG